MDQVQSSEVTVLNESRELILSFEQALRRVEGHAVGDCFPLKHIFAPGVYAREITLPAGVILTGKVHKEEHLNFISKGRVHVYTEQDGLQEFVGPMTMVSKSGTKRVVHVLEETVWTTIHHNPENKTDLLELEELVIAPSYDVYDKLQSQKLKIDILEFRELTKRVIAAEKPGFWSDWTEEQQKLYSEDWKAFSVSRGYSEQEIADYEAWLGMVKNAMEGGLNPYQFIGDLALEAALKNISLDTKGEIMKSSHLPKL